MPPHLRKKNRHSERSEESPCEARHILPLSPHSHKEQPTLATPGTAPVLETVTPDHQRAFIEVQFPVAKLSAESYKERKAGAGQTLTGLGKWWGRKPLVLVR